MRIIVTGGAGFIASHIVDRLIELGHHVGIVDNLVTGKEDNINNKAIFYKCDITEIEKLKLVFKIEKAEIVIHHAAQINIQTSLEKPVFDAVTNMIGTINILECCREFGVKKIIYPSSAAVYGQPKYLPVKESHEINPISFYGISKHTPEHYIKTYAQLYGLKYTIQKHKKFRNLLRTSVNLLVKQKKSLKIINNFVDYFIGYKKDPYNTFDYMIDMEKGYSFKSSFYFMCGGNSEFDNFYNINDIKIVNLIKQLENYGFEVGCHCSFNSYKNFEMLKEEKDKLDNIVKIKTCGCRQHFLRFKAPYTWRIQEKAGLLYDTTLSFADAEGFRCGTCFPFKPYDLLENRILDVWEIPLILMEGSLQNSNYRAYKPEKGLEETKKLIDTVRKHKGVFTMLYHNSSFEPMWEGWKETYECTMKYLYDSNCLGTSGIEIINKIT